MVVYLDLVGGAVTLGWTLTSAYTKPTAITDRPAKLHSTPQHSIALYVVSCSDQAGVKLHTPPSTDPTTASIRAITNVLVINSPKLLLIVLVQHSTHHEGSIEVVDKEQVHSSILLKLGTPLSSAELAPRKRRLVLLLLLLL